jgi:diguanylate cyclase (GGDEF)-like protein
LDEDCWKIMAQPGEASDPKPSTEESFLDLLSETLEAMEEAPRGQFLRQYFHTIAQVDLTESQANEYWQRILQRRRELNDSFGRKVSLKAAIVDVLASTNFLRVPIMMEYADFKKLQINAATDGLTGLYNRRLFDESCDKELNRAKRYGQQLAIVILDLHKLKEVNDRHGHLRGDEVLVLAASTLRRTLRVSDSAFRIGGDEFALLLPQTDPEQALTLCRRVRTQYESEVLPFNLGIGVTLDFGVAVHPQDGDQKSVLLRIADERLYELKYSTRGQGVEARPIPFESHAAREAAQPKPAPEPPAAPPAPPVTPNSPPRARPAAFSEQRKWERVSLADTKARAVLSMDQVQKPARVMDLSYGGVALQMEALEDLPQQFNAVLHVPILPPVRVILRKAYVREMESGQKRVGCSFVS